MASQPLYIAHSDACMEGTRKPILFLCFDLNNEL